MIYYHELTFLHHSPLKLPAVHAHNSAAIIETPYGVIIAPPHVQIEKCLLGTLHGPEMRFFFSHLYLTR